MDNRSKGELATVHIKCRQAAALLGQAYIKRVAQIRQDNSASSDNRTQNYYRNGPVRKEALIALLELVSPNPTNKDRLVFRKRIAKAMQQYKVSQLLGQGILALMLYNNILSLQVELTLCNRELEVQAQLVKKENLDVFTTSKALKTQLGLHSINSGSINQKQTLSIKAETLATIYKVEEILDSKDN